jgi:hypothetical protein
MAFLSGNNIMNFKIILLLFVVVLMIYIIASNYMGGGWVGRGIEGFQAFGSNDNYLQDIIIPQYNTVRSIYKIYDNIFFDSLNGNLIELVQDSSFTQTTDISGSSVSLINIFPRKLSTITPTYIEYSGTDVSGNVNAQNTIESLITSMDADATVSWTYKTASNYEITYTPFDKNTYIHVMNVSSQSPTMLISCYFTDPTATNTNEYYLWTQNTSVGVSLGVSSGTYLGTVNSADGTSVIEPYYDTTKTLYQISQYVKYDSTNGNLCVEGKNADGNKTLTVHGRNGNNTVYDASNNAITNGGTTATSQITQLAQNIYTPTIVSDALNTNLFIYWPILDKTIITQYQGVLNSTNDGITILKVLRFNGSTVYIPTTTTTTTTTTDSSGTTSSTSASVSDISGLSASLASDELLSNYFKWMWYWNKYGGNDTQISDNYILKTQIVPPVCPACPNCPTCPTDMPTATATPTSSIANVTAGVGSGTISTATAAGTGEQSAGQFIQGGISNTAQFGKEAAVGTAQFAKQAITGTAGAVEEGVEYVGKGVGNVLGGLAGTNAASNTATATATAAGVGAPTAAGGAGSNAAYYGASNGVPPKEGGIYMGSQYMPDKYSYNGQIPQNQKIAYPDPLPVTADFSKFGR